MQRLQCNQQRNWDMLMELAQFTDSAQPYTRRCFTPKYLEGREWLRQKMKQLGLEVSLDSGANLIGTLLGTNPELGNIVIGSHSDTVPSGGRFDGIAGVIAGLEIVATLKQQRIRLKHNLQLIDFLSEEPSEWGTSCIGSRAITGNLTQQHLALLHPSTGETLQDAISRMGGNPDHLQIKRDIAASLELHIEQGIQLETEKQNIGIVTGIVGIIRGTVTFTGTANHAGTTPMNLRQDALVASAELIQKVNQLSLQFAEQASGYLVATCGQIFNHPNASNVISGKTSLTFDIRSDQRELMDQVWHYLNEKADEIAAKYDLKVNSNQLTSTYPAHCDSQINQCFTQACEQLGYPAMKMVSGAGHDSAFMAQIAPSSMIFVPSKLGISHNPEEWTSPEQLICGVNTLLYGLLQLDQQL